MYVECGVTNCVSVRVTSQVINLKKRVLFLGLNWNHAGGLECISSQICSALMGLDCEVEVWAVFDPFSAIECGIESSPLAPKTRVLRSLYQRFLWNSLLARRLERVLNGFDLIIVGHAMLLPSMRNVLRRPHRPAIWLWAFGIEVWGDRAKGYRDLMCGLDHIVTISKFTREQIVEAGVFTPITIIPCFVDEKRFLPTSTSAKIRREEIMICGRMAQNEQYKGHEVLIHAVARAREIMSVSLRLTIVGGGDDRQRLEEISRFLGMQEWVTFKGRVSISELVEAYQHCGVFVMPSRVIKSETGLWGGEGFGIVYIEAAACARPVIASTHGGASETVINGTTGYLVDPECEQEIADAIVKILGNPVMADELGRRGRELVEREFSQGVFICRLRVLLLEAGRREN